MVTSEYFGMGPARTGIPQAVRGLAEALARKRQKVSVVMPLYENYFTYSPKVAELTVPFDGEQLTVDVHRVKLDGDSLPDFFMLKLPIVRIVNPLFASNLPLVERRLGMFFDRAAAEFLVRFRGEFDLAHAHTGTDFFPQNIKALDAGLPVVFTLHNLEKGAEFKGSDEQDQLEAESADANEAALTWADRVITVSEQYAAELKAGKTMHTKYLSLIEKTTPKLSGIDGGLEEEFNPAGLFQTNLIPYSYSADDLTGKAQCHLYLQRRLGLTEDVNSPIMLWSQRLVESKGVDIFAGAIGNQVMKANIQVIIFGRGHPSHEMGMVHKTVSYKEKIRFIRFSPRNAYYEPLFIAGSDLVVAPSLEEPFGLLPRKAMRLGTLTWVRPVGGMTDLVRDGKNGFIVPGKDDRGSFENAMAPKFEEIFGLFQNDRPAWAAMQRRAMAADFSWDGPAEKHIQLYQQLL
jgi:starch synthase